MTHRYTILSGGTVIPARGEPAVSAIAWAGDTVIALGSDEEVRGLSRGDSWFVDLAGSSVIPLGGVDAAWPVDATLEVGGRADLAILVVDPRTDDVPNVSRRQATVALIRGGRVVAGRLPGVPHEHEHPAPDAGESGVRSD